MGADPRIQIWNAKTMSLIKTVSAHKGNCNGVLKVDTTTKQEMWSYSTAGVFSYCTRVFYIEKSEQGTNLTAHVLPGRW